jgi:hypothetical protein
MEDFPIADSLAGTGKAQRLDGNVQPELVSILETINYRARDPVDANGNAIDRVTLWQQAHLSFLADVAVAPDRQIRVEVHPNRQSLESFQVQRT